MDRNICDSYEYRRRGSKLHRSENFNYLDHIVNLYITLNLQKNGHHKDHTYTQEYSVDLSPTSFRFESVIDLRNSFVQLTVMIMMLSNSDLIFLFNYNCSTKVSVQYRTVIGNQFSLTYLKPMAPYNWNVAA